LQVMWFVCGGDGDDVLFNVVWRKPRGCLSVVAWLERNELSFADADAGYTSRHVDGRTDVRSVPKDVGLLDGDMRLGN
jgi:hypothetical protein